MAGGVVLVRQPRADRRAGGLRRPAGRRPAAALQRLRGGAWALVLPLSIAVVVGAIAVIPTTADVLTWVALLLVPPGCALALGWAVRGARPPLAVLAAPLLAVAWTRQDTTAGELATIVLIAGSAITLGGCWPAACRSSCCAPGSWPWPSWTPCLVFSGNLQQPPTPCSSPRCPHRACRSCSPRASTARASATATSSRGGRGRDPGRRGPVLARRAGRRRGLLVVSLAWDQLFLVYDVLPATIPPAVVLLAAEAWRGDLRLRPPRGGGAAQRPQGRLRPRQLVEHRPRGLLADVVGAQLPVLADERGHERRG